MFMGDKKEEEYLVGLNTAIVKEAKEYRTLFRSNSLASKSMDMVCVRTDAEMELLRRWPAFP